MRCLFCSLLLKCWRCILIAEKRPEQEGPRDDICVFNGKEYLKGQSIPSGQPCKWCTCVDGFNGESPNNKLMSSLFIIIIFLIIADCFLLFYCGILNRFGWSGLSGSPLRGGQQDRLRARLRTRSVLPN